MPDYSTVYWTSYTKAHINKLTTKLMKAIVILKNRLD